eukprot:9238762-Lingulodinium_polyedra.AAC.1
MRCALHPCRTACAEAMPELSCVDTCWCMDGHAHAIKARIRQHASRHLTTCPPNQKNICNTSLPVRQSALAALGCANM